MKWYLATILVMISITLFGQKIEIVEKTSIQRSADIMNEKVVRFTADTTDVYTIKVVGPGGMKMTTPVRKEEMRSQSFNEFTLDTRYWKRGTYFIIAENEKGTLTTRRFTIYN